MESGNSVIPIDKMRQIQKTLNLSDEQLKELNNLATPFRMDADRNMNALDPEWLAQQPGEKQAGLLLRAFRVRNMDSILSFSRNMELENQTVYRWETGVAAIYKVQMQAIQAKLNLSDEEATQLLELSNICRQFLTNKRNAMKPQSTQVGAALPVAQCDLPKEPGSKSR